MKKKVLAGLLTGVMAVSMAACQKTEAPKPASTEAAAETPSTEAMQPAAETEEPAMNLANPWFDCTEEEAREHAPNGFSAPEGATNVTWRMLDEDNDPDKLPGLLVEMDFELDGLSFTAREQMVEGEEAKDISGMNYAWQVTDSVTLANWADGNMPGEVRAYHGDDGDAQLIQWFDIETGATYSLGVASKDLDGFDIQAVAEAIYDPAKQESANMPEDEEEETTEAAALPAYDYPGPELFYTVLYQYLAEELGQYFDPADVGIPCPVIAVEDDSDPSEIAVYGDFLYYNYDLNGDTLELVSGGSFPGVVHVKKTDDGYEVTGMEVVSDGSDFDENAKEIFGEHYDAAMKVLSDEKLRDETIKQVVANYAAANDLPITAIQIAGGEADKLPEENIDSFYSKLD
ncbi:MAG: hypothetical protein IJT05_05545 [Lachnospiraceae bacterium]|nr:hypothetical protein [Lachnospiraceae bacterium]